MTKTGDNCEEILNFLALENIIPVVVMGQSKILCKVS